MGEQGALWCRRCQWVPAVPVGDEDVGRAIWVCVFVALALQYRAPCEDDEPRSPPRLAARARARINGGRPGSWALGQ
jgi:hypothetical protein